MKLIDKANYEIMECVYHPEKVFTPMKKVCIIAFVLGCGFTLCGTQPREVEKTDTNVTVQTMKDQAVPYIEKLSPELRKWLESRKEKTAEKKTTQPNDQGKSKEEQEIA